MIVPSDSNILNDYFVLRAPSSGKPISLSSDGIVITQKLSELLHIVIGDTITIKDDDTHTHRFRVDAIAENYLQHYVFLSPSAYKKAYGTSMEPNQIMANLRNTASDTALSTELMKISGVSSVRFMNNTKQDFLDMLNNLNYIIWVIIISAGLLAFVVLYTLTTINIGERLREIATIKVLGFFDKEVNSYVFSESYILSFLGTMLGLVGGVILHSYVLKTAEMDIIMYVKTVMPQSFIISVILTMLFTWLANRISMISLRKINMVEALKSSE
jgi:putative ABC transport system permease protein